MDVYFQDDQFRSYIIVKFARAVPQMFKTYSLTVHNSKGTGHAELVLETGAYMLGAAFR